MPLIERTPGSLPPGHRCRVDDLASTLVSDWFNDHRGRVPIQAAAGLDRYMRANGRTFAEAFAKLSGEGGPIILIESPRFDGRAPKLATGLDRRGRRRAEGPATA